VLQNRQHAQTSTGFHNGSKNSEV